MTSLSRRDVLAGLTASSAAFAMKASPEQRPNSIANSSQILSDDERRKRVGELVRYFADKAPLLLREPQGFLKYPSVAPSLPGKVYATSVWDWDTLWTSRGLVALAALQHDDTLKQKVGEHISGSLLDFLVNASPDGQLAIVMGSDNPNGFKSSKNQGKPVFGQLGLLACDQRGDASWLAPHFDVILRFYDCWTTHNRSQIGLLVWSDDVAIGDDNDPTTFGRPPYSSANLLLNCLFYQDLLASAELAMRLGRAADHDRLASQAKQLSEQIQTHCWDPRDSYYYTVDVQCVDRRAELIPNVARGMNMSWKCLPLRIQMFTGFLPLWCGIATQQQAVELVKVNYLSDDRLRAQSGIRTLSSKESMYSLLFSSNPSNWLGPVWIISNYFTWKALQRYGFHQEATALADKTIKLLSSDLRVNGSLNEYYHPDTGVALSHNGFMDWNLLVLEMINVDPGTK